MPQIIGTPGLGYTGIQLSLGVSGPVCLFASAGINPNNITDTSLDRSTVTNCDIGSLFIVGGTGLFVKTGQPNTWQQVSVP
jgi:hypothetical protein